MITGLALGAKAWHRKSTETNQKIRLRVTALKMKAKRDAKTGLGVALGTHIAMMIP
jgi:hypothetical protein